VPSRRKGKQGKDIGGYFFEELFSIVRHLSRD
jgi:hypothetical protein